MTVLPVDPDLAAYLASAGAPPKALTSDLWFTLIYVASTERRRIERTRRRIWLRAIARRGSPAEGRRIWPLFRSWIRQSEWQGHAPSIPQQARWLSRALGTRVSPWEVEDGLTDLVRRSDIRWTPGAKDAIATLTDRGTLVGVISNVVNEPSEAAHELLERLGLRPYLSSVQLSCDLSRSKPDPRPYLRCLEDLGVLPDRTVHVGDHPIDLLGARRAGVRPIRYRGLDDPRDVGRGPRNSPGAPAIREIATWGDLVGAWPN